MDNPDPLENGRRRRLAREAQRRAAPAAPWRASTLDDFDHVQADEVYDAIRTIRDPEHNYSLEDIGVVDEDWVRVERGAKTEPPSADLVAIEFEPTVPHCSLAVTIGLCIRARLRSALTLPFKLVLRVREGSHDAEGDVNKQLNDKERVHAALENPLLVERIEPLLRELPD